MASSRSNAIAKGLGGLACVAFLGGCLQLDYLAQAAYGQDELGYLAQPIEEVIEDEATPERTRQLLALIGDVKRYGEAHGLDPTGNYRHFVQLDRPVVVWVVSASKPLSFDSLRWSFPIVGSVPYLGWFNQRNAKNQAAELRAQGYDVDLRGASAYSTLGWFDDPILSSMLRERDSGVGDLVNVVLHESVHATHYVNSQSLYNESLADFIADTITIRYLRDHLHLDRWQLLAYQQAQARGERRAKRFHEAYKELEALYASDVSDADKLAQKSKFLEALRREMNFWRPINNATLAQSRNYHGGTPEFAKLLDQCDGSWERFWTVIKTVDQDDFQEPQQKDLTPLIAELLRGGCG